MISPFFQFTIKKNRHSRYRVPRRQIGGWVDGLQPLATPDDGAADQRHALVHAHGRVVPRLLMGSPGDAHGLHEAVAEDVQRVAHDLDHGLKCLPALVPGPSVEREPNCLYWLFVTITP